MMFVVFDLDGTLADASHREHYVQRPVGQKDWASFHAESVNDPPKQAIVQSFYALENQGNRIEIWTGRDEKYRTQTLKWLKDQSIFNVTLRMRPNGDHTEDAAMKEGWMDEHGKPDLVFEDRKRVVDMWRRNGVACCQVAPGEF